ncbi:MAG TPA: YIP1 family protein [Vicinamibacterales bacterium]|nr:YIP1 family protein [Vicinamibacterales bacterium]
MNETLENAATAPAPKGLAARFFGIIFSPGETFKDVVAHPRWFGMLALCTIAAIVLVGGYLLTSTGQAAWLTQAQASSSMFGRTPSDQQLQAMAKMAPYAGYFAAVQMLIFVPLVFVVVAGICFAIFSAALGGNATFKQVFAVVVHAGAIGVLGQLFSMPLNYARGTMTSATNLGVLLPMLSDQSFANHLLSAIDLFLVWQILVLAIGLAVLFKRRTQPVTVAFLSLYGVVAIVIALVRTRFGGA